MSEVLLNLFAHASGSDIINTMTTLTHEPIDYNTLTEAVRKPGCGAVALFLGTVRDLTGTEATAFLEYEAYAPMAEKLLAEIEAEVRTRWTVGDVAMVHRLGKLSVGEVSVAVAVSTPHRAECFDAARYAIDTLKARVPIWKKDIAPDGATAWVDASSKGGLAPSRRGACPPFELASGKIGGVAFTELTVSDWPRSVAWYRDGLGLSVVLMDEANRFALLGNLAIKHGTPNPGTTLLHIQVPNLTDALAHLAALGIHPVGELKSSDEGYTRARLIDPDGHGIVLFEMA